MSFERDLRKARRELEDKVGNILRLSAIDVFNSVVQLSPVDTGRFRGNWQATLNTPSTSYSETAKGVPDISGALQGVKLADVMFLSNNVPYAETLVNNPSPRWIEREAYKAEDYVTRRIAQEKF